jgi:uncharacterized membrane protein
MWTLLVGRFVNWWKLALGVFLAALPVIAYVFGRRDGKTIEREKVMEDAVRSEGERADFYKSIGEAVNEAEANRPADRDKLVKRLRQHGL